MQVRVPRFLRDSHCVPKQRSSHLSGSCMNGSGGLLQEATSELNQCISICSADRPSCNPSLLPMTVSGARNLWPDRASCCTSDQFEVPHCLLESDPDCSDDPFVLPSVNNKCCGSPAHPTCHAEPCLPLISAPLTSSSSDYHRVSLLGISRTLPQAVRAALPGASLPTSDMVAMEGVE